MKTNIHNLIRKGISTKTIGSRILYYKEVDSTMTYAKQKIEEKYPEGTVIIAEQQTKSRGRLGREWISLKENLLFSVLTSIPITEASYLSIIASISIVRALKQTIGITTRLKWPNDILIQNTKIGGILIEGYSKNDTNWNIIGIGLNTNNSPNLKTKIPPNNLKEITGNRIDNSLILNSILHELDSLYIELKKGIIPIKEWKNHLSTLGKKIIVNNEKEKLEGIAKDVDKAGRLIILTNDGRKIKIHSDEIIHQDLPLN